LLEPRDLSLCERVVGELRKRRAAPERERFPQRLGSLLGIAGGEFRPAFLEQPSKAVAVELARLDTKHVAVPAGQEDSVTGAVQRLAQPRDVHLNDLRGARRRLVRPELVDQAVARYDLVRVQKQEGENSALLAAAHIEHALLVEHFERP